MTTSKRRRISAIERDHVRMKGGVAVAEPGPKNDLAEIKRKAGMDAIARILANLTPAELKY